jgi:hypothetical protein
LRRHGGPSCVASNAWSIGHIQWGCLVDFRHHFLRRSVSELLASQGKCGGYRCVSADSACGSVVIIASWASDSLSKWSTYPRPWTWKTAHILVGWVQWGVWDTFHGDNGGTFGSNEESNCRSSKENDPLIDE